MINEVKLRTTIPVDNCMPTSYDIKGKKRILITEDYYMEIDVNQKPDYVWPKEYPIYYTTKALEKRFLWESDDNGNPVGELNTKKKKVIDTFLMEHPLTLINGKPHAYTVNGSPVYYDIIDVNVRVVNELKEWDNKHKVANHLANSTYDELRNICYYYGVLPKGKTRGGILIELADYNRGILFTKDKDGNNKAEGYMKAWMSDSDPDKELLINGRKAINLNIINTTDKEGQITYYLGKEMIGHNISDVVLFCKQNREMYEKYVVKGIKEKDQFSEDTAATELENKNLKGSVTTDYMEREKLREEVLRLQEEVHGLIGNEVTVKTASIRPAGSEKLLEQKEKLEKQLAEAKKAQTV